MRSIVLSLVLLGSAGWPVLAQDSTAAANPQRASNVALIATVMPTVVGLGLMVGSDSEGDLAGVGYLLASSGVLFGPAIGNWVGGLTGRGFAGLGIRAVAVWGSLVVAAGMCGWDCSSEDAGGATAVFLIGSTLGLGHAIWDVMTVHDAVARSNARKVTLAPWISPTGATGVAVNLRF